MNIICTLNKKLLEQPFSEKQDNIALLSEYQNIASRYAKLENSIAVLSDLKLNKSYIYNGALAEKLGIDERGSKKEINSIWEEDIFSRILPDDLIAKHLLELQYFHLLKTLPIEDRCDYYVSSKMRMRDRNGSYIPILHRMFYVCSCTMGNLWLDLCLYNHLPEELPPETPNGVIVNSATGAIIKADRQKCKDILSTREKEILRLIGQGKMSKEIAGLLSISKNTVDRHRQNILEKLQVKSSIEACNIAKLMNLL